MDWRGGEWQQSCHLKANPVKFRSFAEIFEMIKLQHWAEGCVFNGSGFCMSQQEHLASSYFFLRTLLPW